MYQLLPQTVVVMDTAVVADMHRVVAAAQLGHGENTVVTTNGNSSVSPMIDFDAQVRWYLVLVSLWVVVPHPLATPLLTTIPLTTPSCK